MHFLKALLSWGTESKSHFQLCLGEVLSPLPYQAGRPESKVSVLLNLSLPMRNLLGRYSWNSIRLVQSEPLTRFPGIEGKKKKKKQNKNE